MTKLIYFVVYREIFFYVSIRRRYIRLRLIIIVIRNEKLHAVFGEKFAEFVTQLRCERFVVRDDERGTLNVLYNVCHSKSFARSRNAQKNLRAQAVVYAFG